MSKSKRVSVFFDRNTNTFAGLNPELLLELSLAYPGVNLRAEFIKMIDWLLTSRGAHTVGTMPFITKWLSKAPIEKVPELKDASLDQLVDSYLKDAWTRHGFLETLNTRKP